MADPVQQNVSQTTIPDYARPYVENMLGQSAALTDINQNPYQSYDAQRIAGFTPMQAQAFQNVANQQVAGQVGEASNLASTAGMGQLNTVGAAGQYGNLGSAYGNLAAGMAPQAQQYGATGSAIGTTGGMGYGAQGAGYGQTASQAGNQYAQMATNPYATQAYMNPYLQSSLAPQLQMMDIQNAQTQAKNQAQAVGQGAFGGNRQAVLQGQTQFNNNLAKQNLIGQGYNTAFNTAQQAQQFGANLGLQGQQTAIQGANTGLQGVNTAMQGQQLGLSGLQQANQLYGQGMAGAQIGLQGVGAQQAGYAGANQAANTLGQLGQTQFAQEQAITADQQRAGAVQQAQQQQGLDVAYQDFLKQKAYPYQQLSFQSDILRGVPLSQTTDSIYKAAPNVASQAGGLGMTALGVYGMANKAAKGGLMAAKAFKEGGKISYASGGDISMLSTEQLTKLLESPTLKPMERNMIEEQLMLLRRMAMNPESQKIMAPAERSGVASIATNDMVPEKMAGGGIVAFATGDVVNVQNPKLSEGTQDRREEMRARETALYKRLFEDQDPFAESKKQEADIRAQAAESKRSAPWEALTMAGLATMQGSPDPSTRQNFLGNLAYGAEKGMGVYGKRMGEQADANKLLLTQGVEREKSKYARDIGNLNAITTSLGQMDTREIAVMNAKNTAAATSASREYNDFLKATTIYSNALAKEKAALFRANKDKFNFDADNADLDMEARNNVAKTMPKIAQVVGAGAPVSPLDEGQPKPGAKVDTKALMPMPATKDALVVGKSYNTSKGPAKWDGTQFLPI